MLYSAICASLWPSPYNYFGYRKVSAICRVDSAALSAALPEQLTLESDIIEVFVMDVPDAGSLGSYREGGIVARVRYGEYVGGHVLYEYVTSDDSMAAGREIWGYPKSFAKSIGQRLETMFRPILRAVAMR
ncbi:acetoacetate decarboxylase family protein [Ochrobactrum haematophilum]|uniref:Acetoacetate decarboxylase family protein n=1 Tax=Brucella haematophila TaxID=419474 RepID=A0ABX1DQH3_9HYPH|nr:acetoacetate decarboxylase family protein [Brucella haematophila]